MKDLVEIGHLTKYHAFRVNRDQVVSLEYGSKSIQTTVILTKRPPKLYKLLKFCKFCGNCKIPSCTYYLKEATMKIAMFAHFKEYDGNHKKKKLRVYMILGDGVSKLETLVWILNRISRSITWPLFTLKASYLVK